MIVDMPNGNGIATSDRLTHLIAKLEELAGEYALDVADAQAALDAAKTKAAQVHKALAALSGESAHPTPKRRRTPSGNVWTPSEERIAASLAVMRAADGDQLTVAEVAERAGQTRDVTRKTLDILRDREQIRFVGKAGQGGAKRYTLMPNV